MKYIEAAVILLGLLVGAIVGSMIPIGNGNAAFIGALLVPAIGLLVLFFVKQGRRKLPLEELNQQNQLTHQYSEGSDDARLKHANFNVKNYFRK